MSVNKVILIGNLGADPEVRYLDNKKVVANIRLATSESYKDREGNKVTQTEWHSLELWDELAKFAENYLKKGREIYIEGKIKTDQWQDKDGNNQYRTKIRVNTLTLLRGGDSNTNNDANQAENPQNNANTTNNTSNQTESEVDDLPF